MKTRNKIKITRDRTRTRDGMRTKKKKITRDRMKTTRDWRRTIRDRRRTTEDYKG
jgi:hypothetical protein